MTLDSLPQADRDGFEQWKGKIIKDCAWEQAFPSLAKQYPPPSGEAYVAANRVDYDALIFSMGVSTLISADGQFALMGVPRAESSTENDLRSTTVTINGRRTEFSISATRTDGTCVVELGGEKIFEAHLASAVPVIASYDAKPQLAGASLPALVEGNAIGDPVASMDGRSLVKPALDALVPRATAHAFLATQLGTTEAIAQTLFPLGSSRSPSVIRLPAAPEVTPFPLGGRLFGPKARIETIFGGGTEQLELLFDSILPELLAIRVDLAIEAGGKNPKVTAVTVAPRVPHDDAATRRCFSARQVASRFETATPSPAFGTQFDGCAALSSDGFAALADDADTRTLITRTALSSIRPLSFRGWDDALIQVARRLDAKDVELTQLDPQNTVPALRDILGKRTALRGAITDAGTRKALGGDIVSLVFGWYFNTEAPTAQLLIDLGRVLDTLAGDYSESARQMLRDLTSNAASTGLGGRAVACGLEITGDRRTRIASALASVAKLPFSGGTASDLRSVVLQSCPTVAQIDRLEASVAAIAAFLAVDQPKGSSENLYKLDAEPLVSQALEERWTADTFAQVTDLVGFAVVEDFNYCARHPSMVEKFGCITQTFRLFTTESNGLLEPSVAPRYATMARELTAKWPTLDASQHFGVRYDITQGWKTGLWRACSDEGFARSKQQLYSLISSYLAATTFDQRFPLEQQIKALTSATTCP